RAYWTAPIAVPALSYVTMPAAAALPAQTDALSAANGRLSNGRITLELDQTTGGVISLKLDGVDYAGAARPELKFGVPVLERIASGLRTDMFAAVDLESPDWHKAWHTDWQARRDVPASVENTRASVQRGSAELAQRFVMANGDRIELVYRLLPNDPSLQLEAIVTKLPQGDPQSLYLPLPAALTGAWGVDYETGGATVRLDDEQLPYASRHYITTQRFMRISDAERELTVACPDAPLWLVGGLNYGRFGDPDGRVARDNPTLIAWLTNNYWSTNFQADQSGEIRFRFTLLPAAKQSLGQSVQGALARVHPLAAHVYAERGPVKATAGTLLTTALGPLLLTRLETEGTGITLTLLNPSEDAVEAKIGSGTFKPTSANRTALNGDPLEALPCDAGTVRVTVAPRAWTRVALKP
ncbi:MAG TPA: hypothetical protein VL147_12680, partial [Devosia sp.]|nr:hypothetical protein [Devosia sp.]